MTPDTDFSALRELCISSITEIKDFPLCVSSTTEIKDFLSHLYLTYPEILQTFEIRSFFFEKRLLSHVWAGPKVTKSYASIRFVTF
jgi:hypothetical protein